MYAATHTDFNTSVFQGLFSFSLQDYIVDKTGKKIKKLFQKANAELIKVNAAIDTLHPLQVVQLKEDMQVLFQAREKLQDLIHSPEVAQALNIQHEVNQFINLTAITILKIETQIENNIGVLQALIQADNVWDSEEDQHWDNYLTDDRL